MSCSIFDPLQDPSNQASWLASWEANVLNGLCLNFACAAVCTQTDALDSSVCRNCLQTAGCTSTINCLNCVGDTKNFNDVYNCTVSGIWPIWEIFVVTFSAVIGFILIVVLIIAVLYMTKHLSLRSRLWVDKNIRKNGDYLSPEAEMALIKADHEDRYSYRKQKLRDRQGIFSRPIKEEFQVEFA